MLKICITTGESLHSMELDAPFTSSAVYLAVSGESEAAFLVFVPSSLGLQLGFHVGVSADPVSELLPTAL